MNKDETREAIKTMQAYVDGAEIELRNVNTDEVKDAPAPQWNFVICQYSIKPVPRTFWIGKRFDHPNYEVMTINPIETDHEKRTYIQWEWIEVKEVIE